MHHVGQGNRPSPDSSPPLPDKVSLGVLIAFAILPFVSTLLGGGAAIRLRHRLHPFMAFAAGVLVATALVGLAVRAHDFADGMNVVTLALARGGRLTVARVMLLLDALAPPVGAAIGTFAQLENLVLGLLLAGFAGVFLAIGAGHLLPEAHHHRPGASLQLVLLTTAGAALVLLIRTVAG
jgi:zinc transporter ZupT